MKVKSVTRSNFNMKRNINNDEPYSYENNQSSYSKCENKAGMYLMDAIKRMNSKSRKTSDISNLSHYQSM